MMSRVSASVDWIGIDRDLACKRVFTIISYFFLPHTPLKPVAVDLERIQHGNALLGERSLHAVLILLVELSLVFHPSAERTVSLRDIEILFLPSFLGRP